MKAKYIGDFTQPDELTKLPDEFKAFGLTFPRGKFVEVPDKLSAKFEGNSHFETQGEVKADDTAVTKKLAGDLAKAVNALPDDPTK